MSKPPDTGPKPPPGSGKPTPSKPGGGSGPMTPMQGNPDLGDKNRTKK
ncbi:MAG: hypothetical protein AB7O98_00010 [Hyphomonadaceae bacterium]